MSARVLTVDDDQDILNLLRIQLSPLYRVVQAMSGPEGWALIEKEPPDLVVTDLGMPGMNGLDLTEKIKTHERYHSIPVIVLTGATVGEELAAQVWKMGTKANTFFEKPVKADVLRAEIDRLLKERVGYRELPPGKGYYD